MSLLVETIRISYGKVQNIAWHNKRYNAAQKAIFGNITGIGLEEHIQCPEEYISMPDVKCRVLYSEQIEKTEFIVYKKRVIRSLKLVYDDSVSYGHKFTDRQMINRLFKKRGNCDDIIIVKNGALTDASSCNLVFHRGNEMYTPATPLLPGTTRARLLHEGKIRPSLITVDDIRSFDHCSLINAFLEPGDIVVDVQNIS